MSREIKFRAWDKACNSWVEPPWKLYLNGGVSLEGMWATSEVELMQYTGLKDKNGIEIYEGDILEYSKGDSRPLNKGYVMFYAGDFRIRMPGNDSRGIGNFDLFWWLVDGDDSGGWTESVSKAEIIGNIHENPELIE